MLRTDIQLVVNFTKVMLLGIFKDYHLCLTNIRFLKVYHCCYASQPTIVYWYAVLMKKSKYNKR